jgi:zinc and cadmium transporter
MDTSFFLVALSASSLPLLAFLALLLRGNLFKGIWKIVFLSIGLLLLFFVIFDTFKEHAEDFGWTDVIISFFTAYITLYILSHFGHAHTHDKKVGGAKGIMISEAFHSLIDGAVIGATYLVSPLLGYAATIGIIIHELPKIIGTLTIFRSLGLSMKKTITYGILAQIGSPTAALLVYLLGKEFNHEQFHGLEIASISSLSAIVLWIIYLEIKFHIQHDDHNHDGHGHKH